MILGILTLACKKLKLRFKGHRKRLHLVQYEYRGRVDFAFCRLISRLDRQPASALSPACLEGLHDIRALFCKCPCLKIPIYRTECRSCSFGMLLHQSIKALQSHCRFLHGLLHVLMVWQGFFGLQVFCNPVACPTAQEKYDYTCKLDIDAYCLTCCKVYPHVT